MVIINAMFWIFMGGVVAICVNLMEILSWLSLFFKCVNRIELHTVRKPEYLNSKLIRASHKS